MNILVDIGNSYLKCGIFSPSGGGELSFLPLPSRGTRISKSFLRDLLRWGRITNEIDLLAPRNLVATAEVYPPPITWRIAQTGKFPWQVIQTEILKIRPQDEFEIMTHEQVPIKTDVDSPEKVGIDRLLAAYAATKKYGDTPMLIVDAGTAITVDVVQNQTFCGGAILPGFTAQSEAYPKISPRLPRIAQDTMLTTELKFPGRNTKEAIENGLYWGTIGAIRQFYEMCPHKDDTLLILTGGDAKFFLEGLSREVPPWQIVHHYNALVLEGINLC
jgi:pantothenate kinase type III